MNRNYLKFTTIFFISFFLVAFMQSCRKKVSLPLLTTAAVSEITQTGAISGGNIKDDGGAEITGKGVCYGTSQNPAIAGSKTSDGTGTGSFTSNLSGLSPNTMYYIRAYATNSEGTAYGNELSFTTSQITVATLTTTAISGVTSTTAVSGGNITANGGSAVTARGVCWSESSNPTIAGSKTSDGAGSGTFTSTLTGLLPGTTYHVRAYASNVAGTAYGNDITLVTAAAVPALTTTTASSIKETTAASGGNITSDGGATVTARGVCWGTASAPTITGAHTTDGTGTGSFTSNITGLTANTKYYVRAYATNSIGTAYGNEISFTTSQDSGSFLGTYDFESGIGDWWADNGLWEVGTPTVGPAKCHSGSKCAGTILSGNYPDNSNTRLISPTINLPEIGSNEKLRLQFWHWFKLTESVHGSDQGLIQVSVNGGDWINVCGPFSGISPVWTQVCVDLSLYAGSTIRIAFYMTSDWVYNDNGWYVDDVSIQKGSFSFLNPDNFESGIGNWSVDNGLWEVGTPTVGPIACHSGNNCAGTVLAGNYPDNSNTRLISPEITLPSGNPGIFFWHWFRLTESVHGPDQGWIQISVNNSDWINIYGPFSGISETWTQVFVDLSSYAGSKVRIAFYMTSDWVYNDNGWYIDDVRIQGL